MPKDMKDDSLSEEEVEKTTKTDKKKEPKNKTKGRNGPLKDCVFFVDVKLTGEIDVKDSTASHLEELGGKVQKGLSKSVTHVIWKDGKKSTLTKSVEEFKIPVLEMKWVDECKKQNKMVDTKGYEVEAIPENISGKRKKEENEEPKKKKKKDDDETEEKTEKKKTSQEKTSQEKTSQEKTSQEKKKKEKEGKKKEEKEEMEEKKKKKKDVKKEDKKEDKKSKKKEDKKESKKPKKKEKKEKVKESQDEELFGGDETEEEDEKNPNLSSSEEEEEEELPMDELEESAIVDHSDHEYRQKWTYRISKFKYIFETSQLQEGERDILTNLIQKNKKISSMACPDGYEYEGEKFTHLIAGDDKRTLKVLFALAYGAKILDSKWLYECLSKEDFVPEEEFLRTKFKPSNQGSLLKGLKIHISGKTQPNVSLLSRLVVACGGTIAPARGCHYCIAGEKSPKSVFGGTDHKTVREGWLFDSIMEGSLQEDTKYKVTGV